MWLDLMAWDREPRAGTTEPARCLPTPATLLFFQWSCFCFVNIRVYFLIVIIKACESMKSRRIVDINGKGQPMTLLEDNKQYLCDLGIKKNGWDKTQETWSIKGKIIRWLKKLMKFCSPNKQHAAGVSSMPIILCSTYPNTNYSSWVTTYSKSNSQPGTLKTTKFLVLWTHFYKLSTINNHA